MLPIEKIAIKFKMIELTGINIADLTPSDTDYKRAHALQYNTNKCQIMANKITDICKCIRRGIAVTEICGEIQGDMFFYRAKQLLEERKFTIGPTTDRRG